MAGSAKVQQVSQKGCFAPLTWLAAFVAFLNFFLDFVAELCVDMLAGFRSPYCALKFTRIGVLWDFQDT
jgi:hypothetical protein